jgi:ribonucleotide reductase beta subunit family protein with ferritin-like domain
MLKDKRINFRPFEYNQAFNFQKAQSDHYWTHSQIEVDSDLMQYNTEFTDAEKHGINTVLKLFTTYEIHVANYWIDVVYKHFPSPEVRMMAQTFASVEAEHALFYDKLNDALKLSNKEFYLSFMDDKHMKQRVDFIHNKLQVGDSDFELARSLATFSFIEGVVLYSSFAFLMSFQNPPKNKLKNVFTGLSYSVRDEALHADADSWLFNKFVEEYQVDRKALKSEIEKIAKECFKVEEKIIDNIFQQGKIDGITDVQLKNFVQSRINKKLRDIKYEPIYEVTYNPVAKWFYKSINQIEMSDFFDRNPTSYNNNWSFDKIKNW